MKIKTLGSLAIAISLIAASLASGAGAYAEGDVALGLPANDDVTNALEMGPLPFSGDFDTTDATWSPTDPQTCPNSSSVWFVFTADRDMTIKVAGAGSGYEPSIAVFTGAVDSLSEVACAYQGAQYPVTFEATSGTTYHIMAATCCGYQGSNMGGALHLSLAEVLPPPNDDFADAAMVDSLPYSQALLDTTAATTEVDDPTSCSAYQSVWYEYTPSSDVRITVETAGYQANVSVYTGSPGALTEVGCAGGFNGARFQLTGGQRYWVMIGSASPPPYGGGFLSLTIRETNELLGVEVASAAIVTAEGTATVSGTVSCSSTGPIDVVVQLSQTFKSPPGTLWGQGGTTVVCDQTATWSVEVTPVALGFAKGVAEARVQAISVDTLTSLLASKQLKLKKS